ncbi:LLM class flavin-dependent oxidoreductase [Actinomadura rudentiformis]|uniref:LLM class flavin-dependent oxidoreductase n=1 Tax=Actinomadura rudentiformis TaxID=359158 RepID=A0A6H9Z0U8_9ACTN|nr:LLM class flavin-dependent oxidoreductase [Actinomadura rudentiformis]KAB2352800.1 LLM class flavin-dependent oxidoreductase [Actinomadura rudentiformis]
MKVSTVMWPTEPWPEAGGLWRRAEELGFHAALVYDHIAWRGITPWYDAYSTLSAAAGITSRIRLGTLVTSPNFRHPVPTAHAARTIDHISGGRFTLGIGAGGMNRSSDAGILGDGEWTARERAGRFAEWTDLMDALLRGSEVTFDGTYYSAREVLTSPGCVQRPRLPFAIAATGPRGLRVAARQAGMWVTTGSRELRHDPQEAVRRQLEGLREACEAEGRDPGELRRLFLTGFTEEPWLESPEAFADLAGRYAELGITDIGLHWPRPGTDWDADMKVFEAVASAHRG